MTHQYMPKLFHGSHKNPPIPPPLPPSPSYILNVGPLIKENSDIFREFNFLKL